MSNLSARHRSLGITLLAILLTIAVGTSLAQDTRNTTPAQPAAERAKSPPAKPSRVKRVPGQPRYKCEDGECVCKGVLDCKSLIDSGFCAGKEFWQDGEDPSAGGCG